MEGGGISNISSSFGGVGYGGRSSPNSTREVVMENLRVALGASEEKHVAIRGCDPKWRFELMYRKRPRTSPEAPLAGVRLLVIGVTLGGWPVDIPCSILNDFVVLILQRNKGQPQYGYRSMAYNSEDDASWSGDTDMSPVHTFWKLYDGPVDLGMDRVMTMIGMSAGVDRCLAVLAHAEEARPRHSFQCTHFVSICGAFHPFLYERCVHLSQMSRNSRASPRGSVVQVATSAGGVGRDPRVYDSRRECGYSIYREIVYEESSIFGWCSSRG